MRKRHISAECLFHPKSENRKGKKHHNSNGKKTNLCSEEDIAMLVHTCAFVSNGCSLLSEKRMLYSVCTSHICNTRQYFKRFTEKRSKIMIENKAVVITEGFENLGISSPVNGTGYIIELRDILYAPIMMYNIVSSSKARHSWKKIDIDDSDNDSYKGIRRLVEQRNGLTRMICMKTEEGLDEASIKLVLQNAATLILTSLPTFGIGVLKMPVGMSWNLHNLIPREWNSAKFQIMWRVVRPAALRSPYANCARVKPTLEV